MSITRKTILLSIVLLLSLNGFGQNHLSQTIRGLIVDKTTQQPLPGVNVVVLTTDPIIYNRHFK